MVALLFSQTGKRVKRLPERGYPKNPVTIGQHLRKKRLELGVLQEEVAKTFSVSTDTITNSENGRAEPKIKYFPSIIGFLGYLSRGNDASLGAQIKKYRQLHGYTHSQLGKLLKVHATTIGAWENGEGEPKQKTKQKLEVLIKQQI